MANHCPYCKAKADVDSGMVVPHKVDGKEDNERCDGSGMPSAWLDGGVDDVAPTGAVTDK